ncbi:Lnb N-terminal periplasmic domain-containing protein [Chromohalobacter israelensis]|uniref:Lnb N-terminal periplasmic domain-containing protein n=1 Tax=Chromohalobacter israelensis (strain ATCC BAA-138 / DSM 3043 / CIP 106854 / NCIMB 13768 / 1H11) TaxID=290398 RepID=Q1QSQ6_CHRI1|nr:DUF4105 domain-containing protein [Chromohalobacter salexigens]ABE60502.1 conserved hypothetical protein [Chromohalobacter salexigens DSM 3043]
MTRGWVASLWHGVLASLMALLIIASSGWAVLALWYRLPGPVALRYVAAGIWIAAALACCVGLFVKGWPQRAMLAYGILYLVLGVWWVSIQPASDRDWAPDVAHIVDGMRQDDHRVTLENVRHFQWRTPQDFDEHWDTRHYDLDRIRSVDLLVSYWMGPAIAHTLVSFGFDDGRHVTFSVEIRKERGEAFSTLGGFFKEYEVSIIAADERDIVRLRTNVRGEDVYLYRVKMSKPVMMDLFLAYLDEAHRLQREPRYYNTLTTNCTTLVYDMMRRIVPGLPFDYRLLLSGYLPEYVHSVGALAPHVPFARLKAAGHINARALQADDAEDFSVRIREGIPGADAPSYDMNDRDMKD